MQKVIIVSEDKKVQKNLIEALALLFSECPIEVVGSGKNGRAYGPHLSPHSSIGRRDGSVGGDQNSYPNLGGSHVQDPGG